MLLFFRSNHRVFFIQQISLFHVYHSSRSKFLAKNFPRLFDGNQSNAPNNVSDQNQRFDQGLHPFSLLDWVPGGFALDEIANVIKTLGLTGIPVAANFAREQSGALDTAGRTALELRALRLIRDSRNAA